MSCNCKISINPITWLHFRFHHVTSSSSMSISSVLYQYTISSATFSYHLITYSITAYPNRTNNINHPTYTFQHSPIHLLTNLDILPLLILAPAPLSLPFSLVFHDLQHLTLSSSSFLLSLTSLSSSPRGAHLSPLLFLHCSQPPLNPSTLLLSVSGLLVRVRLLVLLGSPSHLPPLDSDEVVKEPRNSVGDTYSIGNDQDLPTVSSHVESVPSS